MSHLRTGMAGFIALGVFVAVLVLIYFVYFVWALKRSVTVYRAVFGAGSGSADPLV